MGIVKFIEPGVWAVKLHLYCFNTSGSLHSDLPWVMSEINTLSSSKMPSTDWPMCTKNRRKASPCHELGLRGCWGTGQCRAVGPCRDVRLPSPRLQFAGKQTSPNMHKQKRALSSSAEMGSSCLLQRSQLPTAPLDIFEASAGLLLSTG